MSYNSLTNALMGFKKNSQSAKLEGHRGERFDSHQESHYLHHNHHSEHHNHRDQHLNNASFYPNHHDQHFNNSNYNHHHHNYQPDHQHPGHSYNHHHHVIGEPNDSFGHGAFPSNSGPGCVGVGGGGVGGGGYGSGSGYFGRKRWRHHSARGASPDHVDGVGHAKLYVVPVPRTATEADIRPVFQPHGTVVEVVLLRDKRTGQQQGSCFVKYATVDDAEGAIKALNGQYTFAGELAPVIVKYADSERERLAVVDKLYVGCLNKDASVKEIEEIFARHGFVEDIYIMRDELKQSRGCGFVKFSHKDMALAAIKALHGTFTMRGCDQPLIVRFADPKKPRTGEARGNVFANPNFAPFSQEPFCRSNHGNSGGGCSLPNAAYPLQPNSTSSLPQAVPQMTNQEPVMQQPFCPVQQSPSDMSQMPLQQNQTPQTSSQSSQLAVCEVRRQFHQTDKVEQQLNLQSPHSGSNPSMVASTSSSTAVPPSHHPAAPLECDWSEHTCPDGYKYYFNCITWESSWEKPEEYTSYELLQLQKHQKMQSPSHQLQSPLLALSTQEVAQTEQVQLQPHLLHQKLLKPSLSAIEPDHVQLHSESGPVIDPTCA